MIGCSDERGTGSIEILVLAGRLPQSWKSRCWKYSGSSLNCVGEIGHEISPLCLCVSAVELVHHIVQYRVPKTQKFCDSSSDHTE